VEIVFAEDNVQTKKITLEAYYVCCRVEKILEGEYKDEIKVIYQMNKNIVEDVLHRLFKDDTMDEELEQKIGRLKNDIETKLFANSWKDKINAHNFMDKLKKDIEEVPGIGRIYKNPNLLWHTGLESGYQEFLAKQIKGVPVGPASIKKITEIIVDPKNIVASPRGGTEKSVNSGEIDKSDNTQDGLRLGGKELIISSNVTASPSVHTTPMVEDEEEFQIVEDIQFVSPALEAGMVSMADISTAVELDLVSLAPELSSDMEATPGVEDIPPEQILNEKESPVIEVSQESTKGLDTEQTAEEKEEFRRISLEIRDALEKKGHVLQKGAATDYVNWKRSRIDQEIDYFYIQYIFVFMINNLYFGFLIINLISHVAKYKLGRSYLEWVVLFSFSVTAIFAVVLTGCFGRWDDRSKRVWKRWRHALNIEQGRRQLEADILDLCLKVDIFEINRVLKDKIRNIMDKIEKNGFIFRNLHAALCVAPGITDKEENWKRVVKVL